ncbi:hypothetical protein EYF80_045855 [Liparis tanakae]|uniref:Uncharacterized protein n=1 Tax=Liparis tanakae TaxID=230148 RepID=A0A4Z2FSF9_9TELE|nr:hypothetical protein EYF80_045855 [Liparis tanakae]
MDTPTTTTSTSSVATRVNRPRTSPSTAEPPPFTTTRIPTEISINDLVPTARPSQRLKMSDVRQQAIGTSARRQTLGSTGVFPVEEEQMQKNKGGILSVSPLSFLPVSKPSVLFVSSFGDTDPVQLISHLTHEISSSIVSPSSPIR